MRRSKARGHAASPLLQSGWKCAVAVRVERFHLYLSDAGETSLAQPIVRAERIRAELPLGEEVDDRRQPFAEPDDIGGGNAEGEHLGHLHGFAGEEPTRDIGYLLAAWQKAPNRL